ncbi:MAG: hypothetical protein MR270_02340 [Erysipelotrichaceae bacterium]|nr:hypothetical protein [Erysipelotrichaceae bacterium]
MKKNEIEKKFEKASTVDLNFKDISSLINYEKYEKKDNYRFKKISLLVSFSFLLVICISLSIILPSSFINSENNTRLTTPKRNSTTNVYEAFISNETYDSYKTFTNNFVPLCFNTSILEKGEQSLGVSIPDAYLCFAITTIVSDDNVQKELLAFMGLNSIDKLKVATKEIVSSLCTLYIDSSNNLSGGYNLNSIWLNPNKVTLKEKDEQLYKDLEEIFDASIYHKALTSDNANKYLKENGLENFPVPDINLNDEDPFATANMSVFYCIDSYDTEKDRYLKEYESKNHKMSYTYNGISKDVDYIEVEELANVYEGDNFVYSSAHINRLTISYALPDEGVMPSTIIDDVLENKYTLKKYLNEFGEESSHFIVNFKQPYFKLDNKISLKKDLLESILPISCNGGVNERLASGNDGTLCLDEIIQQSIMTFDYNGFYSCSVTIAGSYPESCEMGKYFTMNLNRPYLFEVSKRCLKNNREIAYLPMVIGEIIDPGYEI